MRRFDDDRKEAAGRGVAPPPEKVYSTNIHDEHKSTERGLQAVNPVTEPGGDRRKTDWAVTAMVAALTALSGNKYLRDFALFSQQDRELETVRDALRQAITRRRRNLRKRVSQS